MVHSGSSSGKQKTFKSRDALMEEDTRYQGGRCNGGESRRPSWVFPKILTLELN